MSGQDAGRRRRIVVATADAVTARMAGPAIRAVNLAAALAAADHDVRLVTTSKADAADAPVAVTAVDDPGLAATVDWCDVFVFQGGVLADTGILQRSDKVFVADVYDPMHLEQLEQARDHGADQRVRIVRHSSAVLNEQLLRADFMLCASAKQRDFWLGELGSLGRLNPATYDEDETLRALVAIVPFGVSDEPPVRTRGAIKGVLPGIGRDDWVILWGGGIYNWFDPLTLLRAVDLLRHEHPDVRLVFMGGRHPNPGIPEIRVAVEARDLCTQLGLDGHVVFNEEWVAYEDRAAYLLDADVGVSTNLDHVEAEFSFRTRMLDYVWAGLPVVATEGDALGGLLAARGVGLTVPPGDASALAAALARVKAEPGLAAQCRTAAASLVPELRWSVVARPLVEFCGEPRRAPDLVDATIGPMLARELARYRHTPPLIATGPRADLGLARAYLAEGGLPLVARRAAARVRRVSAEALAALRAPRHS